jgi:hypothetical protein
MTATLICRANNGSGWVTAAQEADELRVFGVSPANLHTVITSSELVELRKTQGGDGWTFTDRKLADVIAHPSAREPQDLARLPGASITVLCPESDESADLWTSLWRDPRGGISSPGREGRFRRIGTVLAEQVESIFAAWDYRSFDAPHPSESVMFNRVHRVGHARELLIRPAFRARAICPSAYAGLPTAAELRAKQDLAAARSQELKDQRDPIKKRQRMQEQTRVDNELMRLNTWIIRTQRAIKVQEDSPSHLKNADTLAQLKADLAKYEQQLHDFKDQIKLRIGLSQPVAPAKPSPLREPEPTPVFWEVPGGGWIEQAADEASADAS